MSSSSERKREEEKRHMIPARQFDSVFDSFRREMERMMTRPWSFSTDWELPSFFINNTKLMNQFQPTILSNTGLIRNSCQIILVSMETQSMKKMMIFAYLIKGERILISGSNFALLDLILSPSTDLL